jgi:hypothetical protein
MNWLGKNKARLDYFTKTVTFQWLRVKQWPLRGREIPTLQI